MRRALPAPALLLGIGVVLALLMLHFSPVIFGGRLLFSDNYFPGFVEPLAWWTDSLYAGYPFLADLAFGPGYPFRILFGALEPLLGQATAYNLFAWSAFAIAAVGTLAYLFHLTGDVQASVVGALCFGLSGFMQGHVGHETILHTAAWLPWLLLATDRIIERDAPADIAWLAIPVAMAWLGNHPEILLQVGVVCCLYAVVHAADRPNRGRIAVRFVLGWLLGMALTAWQFVPAAEYATFSQRAAKERVVSLEGALPLDQVAQVALPWVYGSPFPSAVAPARYFGYEMFPEIVAYVAPVAFLFAVAGVVSRGARRKAGFWAVAVLVAFVTALGPQTVLGVLRFHAPGFSLFRIPARDLLTMHFGISVLAGLGFAALLSQTRKLPSVRMPVLIVLGLLPTIAAVAVYPMIVRKAQAAGVMLPPSYANPAVLWPIVLAALGVVALYAATRFRPMLASVVALTVVAASGAYFGVGAPWSMASGDAADYLRPSAEAELVKRLDPQRQSRVLAADGWLGPHAVNPNSSMLHGLRNVAGYGPLLPRAFAELTGLTNGGWIRPEAFEERSAALDILNVRWVYPYASSIPPVEAQGRSWSGQPFATQIGGDCGGQRLPSQVRARLAKPVDVARISIVTAMGCAVDMPVGMEVARVALAGGDGRAAGSAPIVAGRDTAEWAIECIEPAKAGSAVAFDSTPGPAGGGSACNTHHYVADLHVAGGAPGVETLDFQWLARDRHPQANLRIQQVTLYDAQGKAVAHLGPGERAMGSDRWIVHRDVPGRLLLENRRAMPRAWTVGTTVVVPDDDAARHAIQAGTLPSGQRFDPAAVALVTGGPVLGPASVGAGEVTVDEWGGPELRLRARVARPSVVVLSMRHYPGWRAWIDGEEAPVRRVDGVLMGVDLPAGEHEVRLAFRPRWLLLQVAIAIIAAFALAAIASRRRRAPPGETVTR